jgi:uncharacterized protein (DUF1697 family)
MTSYVALLRGLNVGGKNKVAMADLVACFEDAGHENVRTHGQSGNVLFDGAATESSLEKLLETRFGMPIMVILQSRAQLAKVVDSAPADHGSADLRAEVIFVKKPLTAKAAFAELPELREGVDAVTAGPGVIYFSRVKATATKTRIQKFMAMPIFLQMTMRSWSTVTKLLDLLET